MNEFANSIARKVRCAEMNIDALEEIAVDLMYRYGYVVSQGNPEMMKLSIEAMRVLLERLDPIVQNMRLMESAYKKSQPDGGNDGEA